MHFDLFSFMCDPLFSIRELIDIITSNYRLVDDNFINPIILIRSPVFHDTFWTDKVSLSSTNQSIFYIFNCLHFTSFWQFSDVMKLKIIRSKWEIDVSHVGPKKSFSTTLYGAFSLVFWLCVFDHSLWLFSSHGCHIICRLISIPFHF